MYEELIKRLKDYSTARKGEIAELTEEAADAIEELSFVAESYKRSMEAWADEAANAQPRWIDVAERLPEHERNVLICYEWIGRSGTVYREVGIASIEELERDPTELFRPLYWMPLPTPPKEETE